MNTIIPIPNQAPIIIHTSDSNDTEGYCPSCHKEESIKYVCKHCNFEYPEEEDSGSGWQLLGGFLILIIILWLVFTIIYWLINQDAYYGYPTLLDMFKKQYMFFSKLRLW